MTDVRRLLSDMGESWPPIARHKAGPWLVREGGGGGGRVSSATAEGMVKADDLPVLEAAAGRLGQPALVMVRPGEEALDDMLADAGYALQDETLLYEAPLAAFPVPPVMTAFAVWPPLAVQDQLWADAGIGPPRRAIMDRAAGPKTAILGRSADRAAGVAFVAVAGGVAFLHALAVVPGFRRQGCARHILAAAADWARGVGAGSLALAVTRANVGACALYASQGMRIVGQYHYRRK